MDEEFFFPQNVKTTYRLLGMGPRHLRRVVLGLPPMLAMSLLLGRYVGALWALIAGAILVAGYVAGFCWPTNGENTLFDLWLHVRRLRRTQRIYIREEVPPAAQTPSLGEALAEYL